MRTLLLAATAVIGVSAAHANPVTPGPYSAQPVAKEPVGRYLTLNCTLSATEKWTLSFDVNDGHAEFSADGNPETARWGYFTPGPTTATALVGDPKAPMNLAVVFTKGQTARLTWVQGGKSGVMDCRYPAMSDVQPAIWHDPATKPVAKPTVFDPQVKPAAASVATSLPLTFSGAGALTAIMVGSTPVTMLVDTGANTMSINESVASTLLANHEATEGEPIKVTFADGSVKNERTIQINTVTVAGHAVHNVRAGVEADNAVMLLSFDVLAQVGPKFAIDTANAKLSFE
jgi:gag-polyprotein putative aspartyl protease